ncbi:MAG: hypothetical protein M1343_12470 [Chloroflexi bacterium]|nr:hypothetical protein [Chloroflexota bacterium]MDA8187550.1 hypothetical protein [Dehalococcoidales bacterium]
MFLTLLSKRQETTSIVPLLNIPVWSWLVWGDHYASLRQVRRALRTWSKAARTMSAKDSTRSARQAVKMFGSHESLPEDKSDLCRILGEMFYSGKPDVEELLPALTRVIDPFEKGEARGPIGAQFTPELIGEWFNNVYLAATCLREPKRYGEIPDYLFHWARFAYLQGQLSYGLEQPQLSQDREFGRFFPVLELNDMVMHSCEHLLNFLGIGRNLLKRERDEDMEHPFVWRDRNLETQITQTEILADGISITLMIRPVDHRRR